MRTKVEGEYGILVGNGKIVGTNWRKRKEGRSLLKGEDEEGGGEEGRVRIG